MFVNFYQCFVQGFSKIAAALTSMLKISSQPAGILPATGFDNSKIVSSSSRNNRKLAKSDFIKPVRKAEEPSFLAPDIRQAFTQLRQAFTKTPIL